MLAIQFYVAGEDLGALDLHSTQRDAFTDESTGRPVDHGTRCGHGVKNPVTT